MSTQVEVKRLGPFVLVRIDYDSEQDLSDYMIYAPARTEEHECEGCWHDAAGVGYCEETTWYASLLGLSDGYYREINPQDRSSVEAMLLRLHAALPPVGPPPATEANHFL